jgi:hypothetical protein
VLNSEVVIKQYEWSKEVPQEFLDNPKTSNKYSSGREIKIGDRLCFAFFHEENIDNSIKLISFHLEEYGTLYEDFMVDAISDNFPSLKYK